MANTREAFLNAVSEDKRTAINLKQLEVNTALDREDQAKVDFFSQKLFPQYLTVLQDDDFYLNTAELELIAKLFNKNMRVIDRSGKLITAVNIPGLQEAPVIIYHEGVHFSRCKPAAAADPLELEAYKSQAEWNEIQELVGHALIRDGQLKTLHSIENKKEAYILFAAGVLSIWFGGTPLAIQAARSGINVVGRKADPEGKDKKLQVAKMLSNSAVGKFIGGGGNLAASLGIDLVDILSRPENQNKTTSSIRSLIASSLKGIATRDPKKFAEYFMGGVVGEAANRLPENDKNTSHVAGVFKAFAQNPELHGRLVEGALKKVSRSDPKPKTGGELTPEEQEKYPKQVLTETDAGIHISEEKGIQEQKPTQTVMQDPEAFARLQKEREREIAKLPALEKTALADKKEYEKDHKDKRKYNGKRDGAKDPVSLSIYGIKHNAAKKACDKSKPKMEKSSQRLTDQNNKIEDIDRRIALASAPKEIKAPDLSMHRVFETTTKKHHHVYIVDSRGDKHSLGKYDNADDARLIASIFSRGETNNANHKLKCSEIQQAMLEKGVSIENIPNIPEFKTPATYGNDFDKNYKVLQQVDIANRGEFQGFVNSAEQILGEKVETQGLSKTEINQINKQLIPKIKEIKQPSVIDKVGNAYDKTCHFLHKIGFSGEVTVGSINLYETKPSTVSDRHVPTYPSPPPQISQHSSNMGQWEGVQAMQQQQMFERNMAYRSPVDTSSQGNLDYQQFWGQGLNPNVQIPPSDWSNLGKSEPTSCNVLHKVSGKAVQMAGFMPFAINKIVPEQTQKNIKTWVKNYIQEWKDDPLKARKDLDVCLILGAKKAVVIAIQAFEQPSLKTRPNTFGLMEVSDRCDRFVAGRFNVDLDSKNAQLGMFVGEFAMPIPMVGAF